MTATHTIDDIAPAGLALAYYPGNLTDVELCELTVWSKAIRIGEYGCDKLAAYILALSEFERQRRDLLAEGNEILEVSMPPLPCPAWSGHEVACALTKLHSVVAAIEDQSEVRRLFQKLLAALVAEAGHRLEHGRLGNQNEKV